MTHHIELLSGCKWRMHSVQFQEPRIYKPGKLRKLCHVLRSPRPLYLPALDLTLEVNELYGMMCQRLMRGFPTYFLAYHGTTHHTGPTTGSPWPGTCK